MKFLQKKQNALFLDRDGVIIYDKHYLKDPNNVELIPNSDIAIKKLKKFFNYIFLFTNQSGVGRGYFPIENVYQCNYKMLQLINYNKRIFNDICIAIENPNDKKNYYRKPSPKFIIEMINEYSLDPNECWMIGDNITDLQAAINANINTAWVKTGKKSNIILQNYLKKYKLLSFKNLYDFYKFYLHKF